MSRIGTYIFFDLETTGLPYLESNQTRITELSMVVVKRRHLVQSAPGQLPRIIHKLKMCFNPQREISKKASEVTGLNNALLENETIFNEDVFNIIKTFIECQKDKPVCLIAHNGHEFDLPILKNHFERLNVSLPKDVMCTDSLYCFYDLWKRKTYKKKETGSSAEIQQKESECLDSAIDKKLNNEKPGNKNRQVSGETLVRPAKINIGDVLRSRYYDTDGGYKPELSFSLSGIYERTFGGAAEGAHRAEKDCLMMAEIAVSMAEEFKEWVDQNHCLFSEVTAI